jgi:hypothetical protein
VDLNVVVRGQSNAFLLVSDDQGSAGSRALIDEVQRLLGFDGANDRVLLDDWWQPGQNTIFGATAFIGEWSARDANGVWQPQQYQQALLRNVSQNQPATETAIVWLHNEYDGVYYPNLTASEWESAVRADAALVRGALGLDAERSPYVFVSAIPFPTASESSLQIIRAAMEKLEADPAFNADVGARALDVDMTFKFPFETALTDYTYGLSHISAQDATAIGQRLARSLAEEWAEYAKPGSPVALAGGNIASDGPKVVGATAVSGDTLVVKVVHDQATGFAPLDPEASAGLGWAVGGSSGPVFADSVQILSADTLQVHFGSPIPADGQLYYGYGYGRLAATNQPGQGNAIYDDAGLPMSTPASGVAIAALLPTALVAASGADLSPLV